VLQPVRRDRVVDFEVVVGFLTAALEKTTDATLRAQAKGWRVLKASEPGSNDSVLYVFLFDPVVPCAEYALGPILANAYPDRIQEIWKLYTDSLVPGATLLNLGPVPPPPTRPLD
jgi:hypothetical protein